MNKTYIYIIMCIAALMLTACQSDDFPVQHPDGYGVINFSVSPQEMVSRADNNYEKGKYPETMGVFGYHDAFSDENMILNNAKMNAPENPTTSKQWTYAADGDRKYWEDYATSTSFDFFAYMPYNDTKVDDIPVVSLTKAADKEEYTLSFPFSVDNGILFDVTKAPMICKTPVHTALIHQDIKFNMDQTLTGFNLQFQLGDKMDNVRDITITGVKIKGDKSLFATSGTVSRTYTRTVNNNVVTWSQSDIKWTITHPESDPKVVVTHTDVSDNTKHTLLLNNTESKPWGGAFYVIPQGFALDGKTPLFTPTIEVTYTVTTNGESGVTTTRQDITSEIVLNTTNFPNYKYDTNNYTSAMGTIYPIQIKIVPSYLYVLADADQQSGYIVIQ